VTDEGFEIRKEKPEGDEADTWLYDETIDRWIRPAESTPEEALRRTEALFAADPDHQRSVQEEQIHNAHSYIAWKHKLGEALRRWKGPDG
jgi:hypothetical protein